MEILEVAEQIRKKIYEIEEIRKVIKDRGEEKARAQAVYDKELAKVLIGLKNGEEFKLDDKIVKNPPATITEKIAKGLCWREKLAMEEAEMLYKSAISNMDAVCSQLNAWQSINRYLERAG